MSGSTTQLYNTTFICIGAVTGTIQRVWALAFLMVFASSVLPATAGNVVSKSSLWPKGEIPFEFAGSIDASLRDRFVQAAQIWSDHTPVKFLPSRGQRSYLLVRLKKEGLGGGSADVGRKGGRQYVSLSPHASLSTILHELGHTLGLRHEHARSDRDQYISIDWTEIEASHRSNFDRRGRRYGPYDGNSVMHYWISGISARSNLKSFGGSGLSDGDILTVTWLYGTSAELKAAEEMLKTRKDARFLFVFF